MKKIVIVLLVVIVLCSSACYVRNMKLEEESDEIFVASEGSWFSSFEVVGERVNFYCRIRIRNTTNEAQEISVFGNFAEDVAGGLVKEAIILGCDSKDPSITTFTIPPGDVDIQIVFSGTFAGNMQKQNRLLPELEIIKLE